MPVWRFAFSSGVIPHSDEDALFANLRLQLDLPEQKFFTDLGFGSLGFLEQQAIASELAKLLLFEW